MNATFKFVDLAIEWSKRGKRWPLLFVLLIPGYFVFIRNYYDLKFRQVIENPTFIGLSIVTIIFSVSLYLLLDNYELLAYSKLLDLLRKGKRVSITKPLARQILSYDNETDGKRNVTVIRELADTLHGLQIYPVVIPKPKTTVLPITQRDQFVIDGTVSPLGFVLRSIVVIHNEALAREIINILGGEVGSPLSTTIDSGSGSIPLRRVYDIQFIRDIYLFELVVPSDLSNDLRTAITRLFLSHTTMTMLYRDRHQAAKRVARMAIDIGNLLSLVKNQQIANIYKFAALNLAAIDGDLQEALRALNTARKFSSDDCPAIAMQIILNLSLKDFQEASDLITELEGKNKDIALLCWLKADYFMATEQPDEAILMLERTLSLEEDEEYQTKLHFHAAFAYAMSKKLSARQQGDGMIRHLEDAIGLEDNPTFHVLKGYGWALRGDEKQFDVEFSKTAALLENTSMEQQKILKSFIENWKARGLRKLNKSERIHENILSVIGSPEESHDEANLMVLAGSELDLAGIKGEKEHLDAAERYLNRVIELNPENGEAYKYRGLIYTLRCQNTPDADEKNLFSEKARRDLLKSIRLGYELPETHSILARLYDIAGDPVNATKHRQRWFELSPNDPAAIESRALTILDQTSDLSQAVAYLEEQEGKGIALSGQVYRLIAAQAVGNLKEENKERTKVLVQSKHCVIKALSLGDKEAVTSNLLLEILYELAVTYQTSGQPEEAKPEYQELLKIDPTSAAANANLAFLLFEDSDYSSALQHWERALCTLPDEPDTIAGKAAALHVLGREDDALASYKEAVALNEDYLNEKIMQEKYFWSNKAIDAVRGLIRKLESEAVSNT